MSDDSILNSEEYQEQVLAYMLQSGDFCGIAKDVLKPEMFSDRAKQWFFDTLTNSEIKLTKNTLKEELLKAANKKLIKKEEIPAYLSLYKKVSLSPVPEEIEHIQKNIGHFIKLQETKRAIVNSVDLMKEGKWDEILENITKAVNSGLDILNLGHNYFQDYEKRLQARLDRGESHIITTGIPELDTALNGGIKTKQVGMIVGGSGRGKTILLEWLGRAGILVGKTAVIYTFEITEDDYAMRYDSMFTRIKPQDLLSSHNEALEKLSKYSKKFGSQLIIKEFLPGTTSMAAVESHYKQLLNNGIRPDLVIIDYIDLVKPPRYYNDITQETNLLVQAICGFAKKYDVAVWTASQLNRGGITSETPDEGGIAGSISKLFNVDIAILMAQTPDERILDEMRLIVSKNRNGAAGVSIALETDFSVMTFYKHRVAQEDNKDHGVDDSNS